MAHWKTRAVETVFEAAPYVKVVRETVELPNGQVVDDFYQLNLRDFALVVPVMQDGRILMLRQYKHGPRDVSVSFPAGMVDAGEDPEAGARRELMEETGVQAGELISLGSFVDNGNQRGCRGHYFLATGCKKVAEPASGDLEDMQEEMWTVQALDEALRRQEMSIIHHVAAWGMARMRL